MQHTSTETTQISLTRFGAATAADAEVVAMLIAASQEPALPHATYLPPNLDEARARDYCAGHDGYVLRKDGVPVGAVIVHDVPNPGAGVALPPRCIEAESWLLAAHRGAGLLRRAWPMIADALSARADFVAAVCWQENAQALASVAARGYERLGRSYFSGADGEGFCEIWIYDLHAHRARSSK
jgi:hypothetical protein